MPDTVLAAGKTTVNKVDKYSCFYGTFNLVEGQ